MTRIGDLYTTDEDFYYGDPGTIGMALCAIADEQRKLRLLKEYELGVLVGEDDGVLEVVAGRQHQVNGESRRPPARIGDVVYDEDQGTVDRSTDRTK